MGARALANAIASALARQLGGVAAGVPAWSPSSLFASGEQGAWYDPSDLSTLFQDAAGSTPVTAVEQPVGKILDKSGRGNHASQATSAARPVLSARKNLLTKTEDFADAAWTKLNATLSGGSAGSKIVTANAANAAVYQVVGSANNATSFNSVEIRRIAGSGDVKVKTAGNSDAAPLALTADFQRLGTSGSAGGTLNYFVIELATSGDAVEIRYPQAEYGSAFTTYQRVNTATDYDTEGFLHYHKLDGVDDGFGTTFPAGTLGSNMDCFMLVRRDSAANILIAYQTASASPYFGVAASGDGGAASVGSGTPTYYVNGVAVPGGTSTTRGQLHTALSVGSFVVLEVRNLDLSAWTGLAIGNYAGFTLDGAIAETILCPAQSAGTRTSIRQYLAAKAGITL